MNALSYGYLPIQFWPQFKFINYILQPVGMSAYRNLNHSK